MQDGIVWFQALSASLPRHPVLIGYRMQSRTWTPSYPGSLSLISPAATAPIVRQGPPQWFYGSTCALGFQTEPEPWQTLPRISNTMYASWPLLVAVDARNAWVLCGSRLLHLDRTRNVWS